MICVNNVIFLSYSAHEPCQAIILKKIKIKNHLSKKANETRPH